MDFAFLLNPFRPFRPTYQSNLRPTQEVSGGALRKRAEPLPINIKSFQPIVRKKGGSLAKTNNIRMIF